MRRRLFFLGLILSIVASVASAEDIAVRASVSSNKATMKEAVQLTLTIEGMKGNVEPPDLTKLDGFDGQYVGPSTQVSIVNGQYSSEKSFTYNLFPTKTGRIQIPSMVLTIDGKNYTTEAIDVDVASEASAAGAAKTEAQALSEKIFLMLEAPKNVVRVGEKLPIAISLFVTDLPVRNIQFPTLEKSGFAMDPIAQPKQYKRTLKGIEYDVVEFRSFIYPNRVGELSVGPALIEGSLVYKTQDNNDFFNNFFGNFQARPISVRSDDLKIKVEDLPSDGRPDDFSGAVGQLDFTASVGPLEVKVGDPLTLRMRISGAANLKSVPMPTFEDSRFKTYEPRLKDEDGARSLEQVIIPTSDGITQVPAIKFTFFDPSLGQYKTVTQGPFPIKVAAAGPGQEFKAVGFSELSQGPIHVEQVDYIQKYIKEPIAQAFAFLKTPLCWVIVLFLGIIYGAWVLWKGYRDRLSKDSAFSRRINAMKNAKSGLAQAENALKLGKPKEFYGLLQRTLRNYAQDKGIKEEALVGLKALHEICDHVQFAGKSVQESEMREHLEQARKFIAIPVRGSQPRVGLPQNGRATS